MTVNDMGHTDVSSSVLSIMASFTNGFDVFKRLREKRRRSRRAREEERTDGDELRLSRSLRQGPDDIGREYQRSIHNIGDHFAVGDAIAQTSLAEILLKLNTGLVSIITSFLDRDRSDKLAIDYRSLADLSEDSRVETVGVLRSLFQRMMMRRVSTAATVSTISSRRPSTDLSKRRPHHAPSKRTKLHGPTVARVVIQDSSKPSQLAVVRPGDSSTSSRRRKSKSSSSSNLSKAPSAISPKASSVTLVAPPGPRTEHQRPKTDRPPHYRSYTAPEVPKARNIKPSPLSSTVSANPAPRTQPQPQLLQRPSYQRAAHSTPRPAPTYDYDAEPLGPLPSSHNFPPASNDPRRAPLQPRHFSIASDSTKLGEIPMDKWPVPFDFEAASILNREAIQSGRWPATEMEGLADGKKKKRFGLGRLFGRREVAC